MLAGMKIEAAIIAAALLLVAGAYCLAHRYGPMGQNLVVDHWTGSVHAARFNDQGAFWLEPAADHRR